MLKEMTAADLFVSDNPGLNPYFNGTCSKSVMKQVSTMNGVNVLILILMEHAQRVSI